MAVHGRAILVLVMVFGALLSVMTGPQVAPAHGAVSLKARTCKTVKRKVHGKTKKVKVCKKAKKKAAPLPTATSAPLPTATETYTPTATPTSTPTATPTPKVVSVVVTPTPAPSARYTFAQDFDWDYVTDTRTGRKMKSGHYLFNRCNAFNECTDAYHQLLWMWTTQYDPATGGYSKADVTLLGQDGTPYFPVELSGGDPRFPAGPTPSDTCFDASSSVETCGGWTAWYIPAGSATYTLYWKVPEYPLVALIKPATSVR